MLWLQIGAVITGFLSALLWFKSAAGKAPPMTFEGVGRLEAFLDSAGRLNRWAAGMTALSMLFTAIATLLDALGR